MRGRRECARLSPARRAVRCGSLDLLAERLAPRLDVSPPADGFLDVAGAAEFLACPPSRVYALVSAWRIPHHRDGSRLLPPLLSRRSHSGPQNTGMRGRRECARLSPARRAVRCGSRPLAERLVLRLDVSPPADGFLDVAGAAEFLGLSAQPRVCARLGAAHSTSSRRLAPVV